MVKEENLKFTDEQLLNLLKQRYNLYEITEKLGVARSTVSRRMKKLGVSTFDYKMDYSIFDCIDTEEKAYWLGFLYADGYVSKKHAVGLGLKMTDYNHLEKFVKLFNPRKINISTKTTTINNKQYYSCSWEVKNEHLYNQLVALGIMPNKSLILKFPDLSLFKTPELIYDFIRGYVDGDGCLWLNKKGKLTIEIIGTEHFLKGVQKFFPTFTYGHEDKRWKGDTHRLIACSNNAKEIADKLYKNSNVHLERKYNIYKIAVS